MKRLISVLLAAVLLLGIAVIPTTADGRPLPFTDVGTEWFCDDVYFVYDCGLMKGMTPTTFEPDTNMSRAMFVTVMGRLYYNGLSEDDDFVCADFSDVQQNSWYARWVSWAFENGIVRGYEDGTFRPDAAVSRQEAATILARYLDTCGPLLDYSQNTDVKFADAEEIAGWAELSVEKLVRFGLFRGDDRGRFNPDSNLTRAECAALFTRLYEPLIDIANAGRTVMAYGLINRPESVYSNMDSELSEDGSLPVMKFTPHEYYNAPWYIGMNVFETDISSLALEYVKVCYKADSVTDPYMTVTSPVLESGKVLPVSVGEEDGYVTALFRLGDLVRQHRINYFDAENPYANSSTTALKRLNIRSLYNTYLKFAVYPFGDDVTEAEVLYFGFFPDENAALEYTAKSDESFAKGERDEYPEPDIREADGAVLSRYRDAMSRREAEIRGTDSAVTPDDVSGKVYYVSSLRGDDSNDGLSPDRPYKTIEALYKFFGSEKLCKLRRGDGVFFERGSVFYSSPRFATRWSGDQTLPLPDGVTVGAYGTGEKPIFTTALDLDGSKDWRKTDYENVWVLGDDLMGKDDAPGYCDVGNVVVYDKSGGVGFGVKVIPTNPADPYAEGSVTWGIGEVSNGFETFVNESVECKDPSVVKHNLEFFHDYTTGKLYMYCDLGNPAEVYDRVIIVKRGTIVPSSGVDVTIDNITMAYCGNHGLDIGDASNFRVQNCTFEWIGGSIQSSNDFDGSYGSVVRYGNGFQNWANGDGMYVENCLFYQIYDGACSTQVSWADISIINDFYVNNCVFIDSNSPIEIWNLAHEEVSANVVISNNYFMNEPVGHRFGAQRLDGGGHRLDYRNSSFICLSSLDLITHDRFIVENNVFFMDNSKVYGGRQFLYRGDDNGVATRNNVMIGGVSGVSDVFQSLPDVDLRNSAYPPNMYDIRYNYYGYTREHLKTWTSLGCDRGSIFYFVK